MTFNIGSLVFNPISRHNTLPFSGLAEEVHSQLRTSNDHSFPLLSRKMGSLSFGYAHRAFLPPLPLNQWAEAVLLSTAGFQRGLSETAHCAISSPTSIGHGPLTVPVERAQLYRARSESIGELSIEEPSAHDRTPMMMYQQPLISDPLEAIRSKGVAALYRIFDGDLSIHSRPTQYIGRRF
jgi:hypothetical protein